MEIKRMAERITSVSARKKAKRLLAALLAILMINPVTGYGVAARAQESEVITAFAELSGEIRAQQLAVGAEESEIRLPDTLDVTIRVPATDTPNSNEEESQPDEAVEEPQSEQSTSEEPATDEHSAGDASVSGNDAAERENQDNVASLATDSEADSVRDSGAEPVLGNSGTESSVETTAGSAVHADTEDLEREPSETTRSVTLEDIAWEIDEENSTSGTFDSSENGMHYTYVPVLPEGNILADGVSLPEISVLIGHAMMRMMVGETIATIGDVALADGKYYNQAFKALDTEPTDGSPYLHYSGGVLTVKGQYAIKSDSSSPPPISINSGTLTIAGDGSLTLESEKPCVNFGTDTELVLSGGGEFAAKSTATAPVMAWGSFRTTEDYSGYIRLEGNNVVFTQMKEIDLKTTGSIDIYSIAGSSAPIVNCDGSIMMTGAGITIRNKNNSISTSNGILVSAGQDVSLTATEGSVELSAKSDQPVLDVGGNITLSATKGVSVYNYNRQKPGVNWKGSKFSITASEGVAVYGQIIGTGDQPTVEIETTEGDENMQLLGGISLGNNGTCTVKSNGSIEIVGYDGTKSVFSGKTLTLNANNDIIVHRRDDEGSTIPVIDTTEQHLTSKNGMVIVSGSVGSFIKTKDGQTIQAAFGESAAEGLVLSTPPTETTFYIADEGFILYTPAQGNTPAVLELTNATINCAYEALILPDCPVTMQLSGKNTLRSNQSKGTAVKGDDSLTITSSNDGTLDISSEGMAMEFDGAEPDSTIIIGGNASVSVISYKALAVQISGNLTVEPTAKFTAKGPAADVAVNGTFQASNFNGSVAVFNEAEKTHDFTIHGTCDMPGILMSLPIGNSLISTVSLHIPSCAQMTVPLGAKLIITDRNKLTLDGKIINNGTVYLPVGTTSEKIKEMNLTGTGGVFVPVSIDGNGMPSPNGKFYANNGVAMTIIDSDLDLTTGDHSNKTVGVDGYAWDGSTLTLGNVLIQGSAILPDSNNPITIHSEKDSVIADSIWAGSSYKCDLTFTGSGNLAIDCVFNAVGGTVTVKDGAQLAAGQISFGGSGNSDSTLNIIGQGTTLTIASDMESAVYVETVSVKDGGNLIVSSNRIGVMAGQGGVNITGGSTLTASCTYGVYSIGGKLIMDESSKLITNGSVAPFCIVDTTSSKAQGDVLSLGRVPSGMEVASVTGTDPSYGYTYWSLVKTGGNLEVYDENHEPVTLRGAVQGEKLDFSKPIPTYTVTVQNDGNGSASATPISAKQGTQITLSASANSGYMFKEWQVISGDVTIADNKFTMPNGNVTVKAIFESTSGGNNGNNNNDSSGGSSDSSSSNNNSSATTITQEKKPDQPVIGSVNASGKVSDNHAVIIITDSMVKTAIEKAQSDAKAQGRTANGIGAEASLSAPGAKSFTITTERAALDRLVSTNVKLFQIVGLPANICFDQASLKQQQAQGSGNITMTLKPVTVKNIRNAYDIALSTVKDGKTVNITSMGNGTATISISYTPGKGEAIGGLYAVSVDAKGNATRIADSAYDTNSKSVIFATNHISVYGIGYTALSAKFTDIKTHWGKKSIDYVVGRGLLSGTSETTFAPDTAMTRGMLVTTLGRLANVDVKSYTTNSFTDVPLGNTFQPYIEWAYKKGIVQGSGNGKFESDRAITREEIAVIFANYAKATGYTLHVTRTATTYADASGISSTYKTAVTAMQQAGIMMGGTGNKFNPKASATRAEVSSMLSRYIKLTIDPETAQGWAENDAGKYLYYKDGKALTGTQTIDGVKYFFDTDGTLKTG